MLIGRHAALIRGPAGSGKSRLAWDLVDTAAIGRLRFARLVADDRVELAASHGRLLVRPAAALAGLIEVRGIGVRRVAFEPVAVAALVIDLAAVDGERIPAPSARIAEISGILLPRLPVAAGADALTIVLATLNSDAT
ncbi:MAG: serine kinase [Xanthobacteraceae bacterium]|nr:serine kinase [Xanthobacteraceae bacterium]